MTSELYLGNSGILNTPEIWIWDSSKVQTFMDSPAKFFYRHLLGYSGTTPNNHLVFGKSMHVAVEYIQVNGYDLNSLAAAAELFIETYREDFPNEAEWDVFYPKTPSRAIQALFDYPNHYALGLADEQILYTEVAGTVPIREDRIIHGKLDTILLKPENGFWSREHKTTKYFSSTWEAMWKVKFQVNTYSLFMHLLEDFLREHHGDYITQGIEINGFAFKKSEHEFRRVPIYRNEAQMRKFVWTANHWYDQIEWNISEMMECSPADDVMTAFPCNGESCSKYGCEFADFCEMGDNPLRRHAESGPPIGYKVEYWDPRRNEEEASTLLEDRKLITKSI